MNSKPLSYRLPIMFLAVVSLIAATGAGLIRLGWSLPYIQPTLPINHGPLMVAGFFGTLISLERAVAMNRKWAYFGPLLCGIGSLLLLLGIQNSIGPVLLTLGSLWLVIIFVVVYR